MTMIPGASSTPASDPAPATCPPPGSPDGGDGVARPAPHPAGRVSSLTYGLLGIMGLGFAASFVLPGEWREFFQASLEGLAMSLIGVLAYVGLESRIARIGSWLLLGVVLALAIGGNVLLTGVFNGFVEGTKSPHHWSPRDVHLLTWVTVGSVLATLTAVLPHFRVVRRWATGLTGTAEWTSVRRLALGGVLALSLLDFVPLLVLGEPPMIAMIHESAALTKDLSDSAQQAQDLRGTMYSLCWSLVAATLAVGFGVRRTWGECLERLGMVRLSARHVGLALGLTGLLFVASGWLDSGISHLWQRMAWPVTDADAMDLLFKSATSPIGAIITGIAAGLGEEILIRGVLQPRMGIVLSNVFFTALHASQYHWDQLLSVFVFGVVLGLVRRKTSTSFCVIVHGGYDFMVLMTDALSS